MSDEPSVDNEAALSHGGPVSAAEPAETVPAMPEPSVGGPALTVAFTLGVTVTKWTRLWQQRHPDIPLDVYRSEPGQQARVLLDRAADVSFVRHPVDRDGLNLISLYAELPVVGLPREHAASEFDEIAVADLADEHLLQEPDEVPEWRDVATEIVSGSRRPLVGIHSLDDAVEQVAAGVGIVILPKSIARLHSRKDVVYVPVSGVAETPVSLAWRAGDQSALVEEFIGIVRGRTAESSRQAAVAVAAAGAGSETAAPAKKIGPVAKAKAKAKAAREAEGAAVAKKYQQQPARKKTQSEQVNKAQARRRKFGGKR